MEFNPKELPEKTQHQLALDFILAKETLYEQFSVIRSDDTLGLGIMLGKQKVIMTMLKEFSYDTLKKAYLSYFSNLEQKEQEDDNRKQ